MFMFSFVCTYGFNNNEGISRFRLPIPNSHNPIRTSAVSGNIAHMRVETALQAKSML